MQNFTLKFKVIKDISEAKKVWNIFSSRETIYDEWEFRYCFYKYFNYELFFYIGYCNDEPIGLLPLQFNTDKKCLEYFGDYEGWMDQNKLYIKNGFEKNIPEFYNQISSSAEINNLIGQDPFTISLPLQEYTYFLPLDGLHTCFDFFLKYHSSKKAKNFKSVIKKVEDAGVRVATGSVDDLETLFSLNIKSFGNDSSFNLPFRKEIFKDLSELSLSKAHILKFILNSQVVGVTFGLLYKNTYIALNAGIEKNLPFSLSSYSTFKKIDAAIELGANLYDVRGGAYGWKDEWHFEKFPQYKFEKKI